MSGTTLAILKEQLTVAAKVHTGVDVGAGGTSVNANEMLCEGRVLVQSGGKGDFKPLWLRIDRTGDLMFSVIKGSGGDAQPGGLLRRATAKGSSISKPKTARKGYEDAFRMDLACDEGKDTDLPGVKFIVAIDPKDVEGGGRPLKDWKAHLKRIV